MVVEEAGEVLDLSPMDHDDDLAAADLWWCNVRSSFAILLCGCSSCGRPLTSFNDINMQLLSNIFPLYCLLLYCHGGSQIINHQLIDCL